MIATLQDRVAEVDANWLTAHLDDPDLRLVEVDVSQTRYGEGHIPGACLWNAYTDLHHSDYSAIGRMEFGQLLSRSGISARSTVVFYGYAPYLGYWFLRSHGHHRVHVLRQTRDGWVGSGHPWTREVPEMIKSSYAPPLRPPSAVASLGSMRAAVGDPGQLIIDVRSQAEYDGVRFWPSGATEGAGRAGHIPGAVHVPIELLRAGDGSFKRVPELNQILRARGVTPAKSAITYCTIGARATEAWFVLTHLLDYPGAGVYAGSWAEWGTRTDTPIEIWR